MRSHAFRHLRHAYALFAHDRHGSDRHGPGRHGRDHHDRDDHHEGPFGRMRRGGRRGGPGRIFDHGDLRFVVLQLIADKPSHGYEIIKAIEDRLHGAYSPSPGAIYPTLTLLEELGHVTVAASEGNRKLYTITAEGEAFLEANRQTVRGVFARMEEEGEARADTRSPQIMRAVHNMKLALRLRIANGPLSREQVEAIAQAVDDCARAIERV